MNEREAHDGTAAAWDHPRFPIVRFVGTGASGRVYEARDRQSGARVALKILVATSELHEQRFTREAGALAAVTHPCVVGYVAHGSSAQGTPYLVMDWLEGETLETRLARGPLGATEILTLAERLVDGLSAAADNGLIHRDLKPANVFLVHGDPAGATILDFGLARRSDEREQVTQSGGAGAGTPLYMSPEQARATGSLDERSDVFALGSVLYECGAGCAPFHAGNPLATLAKICFEEPLPLAQEAPHLPADLCALVHAALTKDVRERPRLQALQRMLAELRRSGLDDTRTPRAGIAGQRTQRVLCALFVAERGHGRSSESAFSVLGEAVRSVRLRDGTHVLLADDKLTLDAQAVALARGALELARTLPEHAFVLCTGRTLDRSTQQAGDLFERGAQLLEGAEAQRVLIDEGSVSLLEARFNIVRGPDVSELHAEHADGEAPRTVLGRVPPFVGREPELAQLTATFMACRDEQSARAALITAPPGGGKSRLRHELVASLRARGVPFELVLARGDALRSGVPFATLAHLIRSCADIQRADPVDVQREKLSAHVARHVAAERAVQVSAFLGELIGVSYPDDTCPELRACRDDLRLMGERLQSSFLTWIGALAGERALLFVVEDLHWADAPSVRFIDAALRQAAERPLCVIAFGRPEVTEVFPALWSERDVVHIRLPKLSARACTRLLEALDHEALTPALRSVVVERADGNPFLLEELLRSAPSRADSLPHSVLGMVQMRLDALGAREKLVVCAASIYGQAFHTEGVRALLGDADGEQELERVFHVLCERELIYAQTEHEFGFRHGLIRDAGYELLPDDVRVSGHRDAARWLEAHEATDPAVLAAHYERGHAPDRAATWYGSAVERAFATAALDDTLRFAERAVHCGACGPALGKLAAMAAVSASYLAQHETATDWAEDARDNLEPGEPAWWRAMQVALVSSLWKTTPRSDALTTEMCRMAACTPPTPEQLTALAVTAGNAYTFARADLGARLLEHLPTDGFDAFGPRLRATLALARNQTTQNEPGVALKYGRIGLSAVRETGLLHELVDHLLMTGGVLSDLGAHAEAESMIDEALEATRSAGLLQRQAVLTFMRGMVEMRRGAQEAGEALLRSCLAQVVQLGDERVESYVCDYLAQLTADTGRLEEADAFIARALERGGGMPDTRAVALTAEAHVCLARGDYARARELTSEANTIADTHGFTLADFVVWIRITHVRALRAAGDLPAAAHSARSARHWLNTLAVTVTEPELRTSFLHDVAEHARLFALADELDQIV